MWELSLILKVYGLALFCGFVGGAFMSKIVTDYERYENRGRLVPCVLLLTLICTVYAVFAIITIGGPPNFKDPSTAFVMWYVVWMFNVVAGCVGTIVGLLVPAVRRYETI